VLAGAQGEHKVGHSGKFGKGRQQIINKQAINNRFGSAQGEHKVGHAGKFGPGRGGNKQPGVGIMSESSTG